MATAAILPLFWMLLNMAILSSKYECDTAMVNRDSKILLRNIHHRRNISVGCADPPRLLLSCGEIGTK